MRKYYLKDLKDKELIKVFDNNKKIQSQALENLLENNMFLQSEQYELLNIKQNINYYDNYNSFYLRIKDPIKFYEDIETLQLTEKQLEIYNSISIYYKRYINAKTEKTQNKNYIIIEEKTEELLEYIEAYLHDFEDFDNIDIIDQFINDVACGVYDNCYILNKKDFIAYEDIKYTKKLD